ncbi:MAG: sigma-70 family RNA polymerase sigma factor [candidate division Zixibacteria bacterium]|nr:sigma-70 family RNA polymerase sigma factor [candidate division Zixibacteria bacterium]
MGTDPRDWVDKYGDSLFRYALVRVRDRTIAEDLVQDTLLAALRQVESFRGDSSERTWLTGILRHKIFDHLRKQFRNVPVQDDDVLSAVDQRGFEAEGEWAGHWAPGSLPTEWGRDPHAIMEQAEFWAAFNECLSLLPRRMASLFVLHVMDGVSANELCNDFGLTPTNLRVTLYRARKQLRDCLEQRWIKKATGK